MSSKTSRRHHYLPVHYLKGFTDKDGGFYVYDKIKDEIRHTKPDSIFFEKHLNTVTLPRGDKSVFIEDQYTDIENKCWPSINRIRATNEKDGIEFIDREFLFMFLYFLYWRLPRNLSAVEELSKTAFLKGSPADYLLIKSKKGEGVPIHVIEAIRSTQAFKKSFRLILPMIPFFKNKNWAKTLNNWRFFYTANKEPFFVVGDNPFIFKDENKEPAHIFDRFIFPVSGNILLINSEPVPVNNLPPDFIIDFNVAMIKNSDRYVISHSKELLEKLVHLYKVYIQYHMDDNILDKVRSEML